MSKEEQFEALPSAEYLHECFSYDPHSGSLTWKVRPVSHFADANRDTSWECRRRNAILSGKKFGSRNTHGHVRGGLDGKLFYAHRIVWKMVHGDEPKIIDHLNGNPEDNSIANLRNGSRGDNQRNQKLSRTSTSGVQGVYFHKQSNGWYARINMPSGGKLSFYSKSKDAVETWRRDREIEFGYSGRASA